MLASQLEIIDQAKSFLSQIDEQDYANALKPHLTGSAGAHMRHILDHYMALIDGCDSGVVDYNKRNRYSDVESLPQKALEMWHKVEQSLQSICTRSLDTPLQIISETSIVRSEIVQVPSTLARELVFVSSHAIHHFSLLCVMRSLQGKKVPENFGIAPATVSFMRQQA